LQKAFLKEQKRKKWVEDSTRIHDNTVVNSIRFNDNAVTVEFRNGKQINAIRFVVGRASCIWIDPITGLSIVLQTKEIKKVTIRNRLIGSLAGLMIGLGEEELLEVYWVS
jgi:hypothetical protein